MAFRFQTWVILFGCWLIAPSSLFGDDYAPKPKPNKQDTCCPQSVVNVYPSSSSESAGRKESEPIPAPVRTEKSTGEADRILELANKQVEFVSYSLAALTALLSIGVVLLSGVVFLFGMKYLRQTAEKVSVAVSTDAVTEKLEDDKFFKSITQELLVEANREGIKKLADKISGIQDFDVKMDPEAQELVQRIQFADLLGLELEPLDFIVLIKHQFDKGNREYAQLLAERALREHQADFDLSIFIARFYTELKKHDQAFVLFGNIQPQTETRPDFWFYRGVALGAQEKYAEAVLSYDRALALDPNLKEAWYNRGVALGAQEKYAEEVLSYDRALAIDEKYATAWYNRGVALGAQEKYAEEVLSYDRALAIDEKYATAWYNRGVALGAQGKYAEAVLSYDRALALDEKYKDAWTNRGATLLLGVLEGDFDRARLPEALDNVNTALTLDQDLTTAQNIKKKIEDEMSKNPKDSIQRKQGVSENQTKILTRNPNPAK
jgi:tetratricopeptide (TPR) repeat protein